MINHQAQNNLHGDMRMIMSPIKHASAEHVVVEADDSVLLKRVVMKLVKSSKVDTTAEFMSMTENI